MVFDWVEALGRRAVAAPAWRWVSGMMIIFGDGTTSRYRDIPGVDAPKGYPNLDDPATVGALVALVQSARRESLGYVAPVAERGYVWFASQHCSGKVVSDTLIGALVAALEAA
jgi:hypothetical protein